MSQMPNPYGLGIGIEDARRVSAAAMREATANAWTVAVAVVDAGGDLVLLERMDRTQLGSVRVAEEKARCAVRFKRPTKDWEDALAGGSARVLGMPGVIPLEGGIPLVDPGGGIVGGVGVSGALGSQDAQCATAGAKAYPGSPSSRSP